MKYVAGIITILLTQILLVACAPAIQPPQSDPLKEQLSMLQKQLLTIQKLESETKVRLDESAAALEALTIKLRELELKLEKQAAVRAASVQPQPESKPTPTAQAPQEKKTSPPKQIKTRKKVRRQE